MLMRKIMVAGLMLVAAGLTAAGTAVIGQQPAIEERKDNADQNELSATGRIGDAPDLAEGTSAIPPQASNKDGVPHLEGGTDIGASGGGGIAAPPAVAGSSPGTASSAPVANGKSSGKTRRPASSMSSPGLGAGMSSRAAPGVSGAMGGMPAMGMGIGMAGMSGDATMSSSVPEDEHLETWVSRELAQYARTEDQNDRRKQQDEIAKALDRIFDIRQQRRMQELEALEQRVQKLRVTLETREKLKSEILKNRIDYLIREADGLGWGDGLPQPGRSAPTGFGSAGSSRLGR